MSVPPIQVEFSTKGLEQIKDGFREMAESSRKASRSVAEDSKSMIKGMREVGYEITALAVAGRSITELGERFGFLTEAQAENVRVMTNVVSTFSGLIVALPRIISLIDKITSATWLQTAAEWAHVVALKAKAIAAAFAYTMASGGIMAPILVAAAAAVIAGLAVHAASIPEHHYTGPVLETGPQILEAGEYVFSKETVRELHTLSPVFMPSFAGTTIHEGASIVININGAREPRAVADETIDALKRARVI